MLSHEDNELLCRVGRGTPMGALMREYWIPAALSSELPEPEGSPLPRQPPVRPPHCQAISIQTYCLLRERSTC